MTGEMAGREAHLDAGSEARRGENLPLAGLEMRGERLVPIATPSVVAAITAVMADVREIGKGRKNEQQGFKFRGIDDFYRAYHGPMSRHGLVIVPVRTEHVEVQERVTKNGGVMRFVSMTVTYRIYGPGGDSIEAQVRGEAQDSADKATNKAMSAAQKYLFMQVFVPPVEGAEDADEETHELAPYVPPDTGGFASADEWRATVARLKTAVRAADEGHAPGIAQWVADQKLGWPWRRWACDIVRAELEHRLPAGADGAASKAEVHPGAKYQRDRDADIAEYSDEPF